MSLSEIDTGVFPPEDELVRAELEVYDRSGAAPPRLRGQAAFGYGHSLEDSVKPAVDRLGDLLPAFGGHHQVRTTFELDVVRLNRGPRVLLVLFPGEGGRNGVVLFCPTMSSGADRRS